MGQKGGKHAHPDGQNASKQNGSSSERNEVSQSSSKISWNPYHREGVACYEFEPTHDFQVPLKEGDKVIVYKESNGWYMGAVVTDADHPRNGVFPASYIKVVDTVKPEVVEAMSPIRKRLLQIREQKRLLQEKAATLEGPANAKPAEQTAEADQKQPQLLTVNTGTDRRRSVLTVVKRRQMVSPRSPRLGPKTTALPVKPVVSDPEQEERADILETFEIMQEMKDGQPLGYVRTEELYELLPTINDDRFTKKVIDDIVSSADPDNTGQIQRDTYVSVMLQHRVLSDAVAEADDAHVAELMKSLSAEEREYANEDTVHILHIMDPDNRGYVDVVELLEVLDDIIDPAASIDDSMIELMLVESDPGNTGHISRPAFLKMMQVALEGPPKDMAPGAEFLPIFTRKRTISKLSSTHSSSSSLNQSP